MIFRKKNSFKTVFDSGFKAKYIHFWVFFHTYFLIIGISYTFFLYEVYE